MERTGTGWEALAYGLEPQWLLWVKGEDVALMRAQIDGSVGKNKPCATPQNEEEFSYPTAFFLSGVFSRREVLHLGRKVAVL